METILSSILCKSSVNVLILPMRNGNPSQYSVFSNCFLVLILPMRNGNLSLAFSISELTPFSSYPTYEEWKLVSQLINQIHYFHRVLILPMRNGNNSNGLSAYISYLFLSYLWGMETILSIIRISEKFRFLSYLWGMETHIFQPIFVFVQLSSYPTYEEWKQTWQSLKLRYNL